MVQSELSTNLSHVVLSLVLAFAIVADRGCGSAAVLKPSRVVRSTIHCHVQDLFHAARFVLESFSIGQLGH